MLRKCALFLLILALVTPTPRSEATDLKALGDVCLKKICFAPNQQIGDAFVPLKGIALLEYLRFDMYTAALYVSPEMNTIQAVLGNVPKSLVLHYHRGIKIEWMFKAADHALQKNPNVNYEEIKDRVSQINEAYQKVKKGDRYALQYVPEEGTTLLLNGSPQITIPGEDFAAAYLGIWLSEYPANKKLRDKLINGNRK